MSALSSTRGPESSPTSDHEDGAAVAPVTAPVITEARKRFFDTFGFLHIPGLFKPEIATIDAGFEEVFEAERDRTFDSNVKLSYYEKRSIIGRIVSRSDKLSWLLDDPRTTEVISTLMGRPYEYVESDGSIFSCDTGWHPDSFGAPLSQLHIKLSFYLDPLHGQSGAIRVVPGTSDWQSDFAVAVRDGVGDPEAIEARFGVAPVDLPSWTLENEPGDLIVWNYRTVHASFNGGQRRRLFSLNYREELAPDDVEGRRLREEASAFAKMAAPGFKDLD